VSGTYVVRLDWPEDELEDHERTDKDFALVEVKLPSGEKVSGSATTKEVNETMRRRRPTTPAQTQQGESATRAAGLEVPDSRIRSYPSNILRHHGRSESS
jgi:hypothetical protein